MLKLGLICVSLCLGSSTVQAKWWKPQQDHMGTRVSLEIWHDDINHAQYCGQQVFDEFIRLEKMMSSYQPDSQVSRINQHAGLKPVDVDQELVDLIELSLKISTLSAGAFDISYASVGHRYHYREKQRPDNNEVNKAIPLIDYRKIHVSANSVFLSETGMRIDLGGIAKGYAVDRAMDILVKCNITTAFVSAGGDSRMMGDKNGRPWVVGIRHPRREGEIALKIPLSHTAVSTSGDYERFFFDNGERVHHIINPKTGHSAKSSWSATVIGPETATTDALSTSLFVLGVEKGLKLVHQLPEIDAIIIDNYGKVHYSNGLMPPSSH